MNSGGGCTCVVPKLCEVCGLIVLSLPEAAALVGLQAYDQHLNMILGDVEETVTTVEIDEETYEELYKVATSSALLCVCV